MKRAKIPAQTGRDLIAAKDALKGTFLRMLEEGGLPFGSRTAEKLMAIARNPVLTDSTHESKLPDSWTTQFELTKLPLAVLRKKFADGSIHPELERATVDEWVRIEGWKKQKSKPVARPGTAMDYSSRAAGTGLQTRTNLGQHH
jgi:hypothetical protein